MKRIENILLSWSRLLRTVEYIFIDNVAATTPWLAPLIPAYLVYTRMIGDLAFPEWVALVGAGAVEFLGLSAVYTALEFWQYNDSKKQTDNSAPFIVALFAGLFYITVILTVNAILALSQAHEIRVLANALLSLLSVDAAVIIAIRSQHRKRLSEHEIERERRREERKAIRQVGNANNAKALPMANHGTYSDFLALQSSRNGNGKMTAKQVSEQLGVPLRTAYNWIGKYDEGESAKKT